MPQTDTSSTFKNNSLANVGGIDAAAGQTLTVEFLTADPTLTSGQPRIWVNTTTGVLKFSHDGTTTRVVTAT
jgi:hypothetical protein